MRHVATDVRQAALAREQVLQLDVHLVGAALHREAEQHDLAEAAGVTRDHAELLHRPMMERAETIVQHDREPQTCLIIVLLGQGHDRRGRQSAVDLEHVSARIGESRGVDREAETSAHPPGQGSIGLVAEDRARAEDQGHQPKRRTRPLPEARGRTVGDSPRIRTGR